MKRRRSSFENLSDESLNPLKKQKIYLNNENNNNISLCDWNEITNGNIILANLEEMKKRKLTVNNNPIHFESPNQHLLLDKNDIIGNKYKIIKVLGEGTFGIVYHCKIISSNHRNPNSNDKSYNKQKYNKEERNDVAIKVIRSQKKYRSSAIIELNTISLLHYRDPTLKEYCLPLLDWFAIGEHICMVFPLQGETLLTYIENIKYLDKSHLRDITWQILIGIAKLHNQGLVHTDLKPENIIFKIPFKEKSPLQISSTDISLIDFGNSTFIDSHHSRIIATRHYRPPEVLLNCDWSYSADIWSIGCILLEIYTGKVIFSPDEDIEHLAMMEKLVGYKIPYNLAKSAQRESEYYFNSQMKLHQEDLRKSSIRKSLSRIKPLKNIISRKDEEFYQMIVSMLELDPKKRCSAQEALNFPYFTQISIYNSQLKNINELLKKNKNYIPIKISYEGLVQKVKK